ncbi:MAG: hypothetical protein HZC36_01365 [Armatimonadetes bacterium]|nr:hypothetical protein [Armatimonadota bacterium]
MKVRWDPAKGAREPLAALDRVPLEESGEPLVSLLEGAPTAIIARDTVIPYLRRTAAEMLERAARSLPKGYVIGVTDAWRPFERQKRIYEFMLRCAREAYPDRPDAALRRTVNRVVHAYDRKAPPGHCTGAAVDVNLLDLNGNTLDVSAPFDRFAASRTYTLGLDRQAQERRTILVEAMLGAGFSNCRDEWWHYSYGDAAWAVRLAQPVCFYGVIGLDPKLYVEQEAKSEEMFKTRENPFLPDPVKIA